MLKLFLPSPFRLALYVYEYLLHVGAQKSAQTFLSEVRHLDWLGLAHFNPFHPIETRINQMNSIYCPNYDTAFLQTCITATHL